MGEWENGRRGEKCFPVPLQGGARGGLI